MEKKTPLYKAHVAAGGKIVPFAGYLLPVQYPTGVIAEHKAVRTACGLFDVSHMGEIRLSGPGALTTLNHLMTNDYTGLAVGRVRYSAMCSETGGVIDDLVVYRMAEDEYLIVVNAANREKDAAHIRANLLTETVMEDISDQTAQLALQGPKAAAVLAKLTDAACLPRKYYSFTCPIEIGGIRCLVSRTGYTGEVGYELYCANDDAAGLWELLLRAGADEGLIPCGLGARDTLRLEAAMPLYGHEMDETVSPLETGLEFAVRLDKAEFIGRDALLAQGKSVRTRVGLRATGRGILREKQDVYFGETRIGATTSGTFCPFLQEAVAMALVETGSVSVGDAVEVDVRGRRVTAEIVQLPFYKR